MQWCSQCTTAPCRAHAESTGSTCATASAGCAADGATPSASFSTTRADHSARCGGRSLLYGEKQLPVLARPQDVSRPQRDQDVEHVESDQRVRDVARAARSRQHILRRYASHSAHALLNVFHRALVDHVEITGAAPRLRERE